MITKFEETGELDMLLGRGRKQLSDKTEDEAERARSRDTQNCRIWGTASPNVVHEQSLYPDYITAWCGITADFILGPLSLRRTLLMALKGVPLRVPVTASHSCFTITKMFRDYCHHADGAPPHFARPVQALLRAHFGDDRVISRSFRTAWPLSSLDLNPCDF
ncbi:hypothetical protein AVEN_93780-1 [Araneus ventricosus]|uniref:Uncharacterized protein n=1 Tax=Araneus ventricosus TaxID=182803 RepID=A0A4Y2FRM9_ARAVE|nr:hypothetical protein AVEN_93780-1 [Araneus ventricosus]